VHLCTSVILAFNLLAPGAGLTVLRDVLETIPEIGQGATGNQFTARDELLECGKSFSGSGFPIGVGLPPIPARLVAKIEAGEFIEMSDLLSNHLGTIGPEEQKAPNFKRNTVKNILEWIKCYCIYMAVVTKKSPHKISDMLAYLTLIIEAHMEYAGDAWLGYDRRFRQRAAADPSTSWAVIDTTLWNLAFSGKAKASRCKHCFSLTHTSAECEWTSAPGSTVYPSTAQVGRICFDWNRDPRPGCSHADCTYKHVCTNCAQDPSILNKFHKAVFP